MNNDRKIAIGEHMNVVLEEAVEAAKQDGNTPPGAFVADIIQVFALSLSYTLGEHDALPNRGSDDEAAKLAGDLLTVWLTGAYRVAQRLKGAEAAEAEAEAATSTKQ